MSAHDHLSGIAWREQRQADVPPDDWWLSAAEMVRLQSLRFGKRRADWRLGRWTAKRAVADYCDLRGGDALRRIEIRATACGAPEALIDGVEATVVISISHRDGAAACAVAPAGALLGCDLEIVEPHGDAFLADYFTPEEQALVRAAEPQRAPLTALLWSAKESALKALRQGLRVDTREVAVSVDELVNGQLSGELAAANHTPAPCWWSLQARYQQMSLSGYWQQEGKLVKTVVASPVPLPPNILCSRDRQTFNSPVPY